jgi:Thioredoxin-like proteins and domains
MINFTPNAKEKIRIILKDKDPKKWGVQLRYEDGFYSDLIPIDLQTVSQDQSVQIYKKKKLLLEVEDFKLVVAKAQEAKLEGATIDYIDGGILRGVFEVTLKRPEAEGAADHRAGSHLDFSNPQIKKISELLEQEINPAIASHGGTAELVDVKDNYVYLRMGGGCQGCASSAATLKAGIEMRIKEEVPEIIAVIDQTDHAAGENPYFK